MNIKWISNSVKHGDYFVTHHADAERQADNLTILQIEEALMSGKIIENYPEDKRGGSCLVAGFTNSGIPVHAVCGVREKSLVIITIYIPSPPKFKNPYERG